MKHKRVLLLCGHYGSGKTNIAVSMALKMKELYPTVTVADLDIVNPYFRSKDSADAFSDAGIRLICSEYANTNVDIPALPQDLYAITDDKRMRVIIDVGGDDRGALALGRITPALLEEDDYEMLMVINAYRPLTRDAASTMEVMREIETACGIRMTGLINNSNLGDETTPEDVLASVPYAQSVAAASGLPIRWTTVDARLLPALEGKLDDLFPLHLQKKL